MKEIVTEKQIKENWDKIWQEHNKNKFLTLAEKVFYKVVPIQFSSKTIFKELHKIIKQNNLKKFSIIECGCGSGYIQKRIFTEFQTDTYFLDISKDALDYTKENIKDVYDAKKHHFLEMSALKMDLKDNSYDIVWNGGVLEHFEESDQKKMVQEMVRITKKGGFTVFFVPSTYGKIYLKMKKRAEELGTWQAGYEKPLSSIKHLLPKGYENQITEYSVGFSSQFHYLKYYFKKPILRYIATFVLEFVQRILFFMEGKPGYFLVSIIKK